MKKTTKGRKKKRTGLNLRAKQIDLKLCTVTLLLTSISSFVELVSVTAPTEGKLDIEAIKEKVKRAKTKKLGAPPVNPAPPTSSTTDKKKKKAKSKG